MGDVLGDCKLAERCPSRWMNDTLSELGTVESLLLLEQERIALVRDTADVEGVSGVRDELTKVGGIVGRVVGCARLTDKPGNARGGLGGSFVQTREELGALSGTGVDAGDLCERVLDEACHGGMMYKIRRGVD